MLQLLDKDFKVVVITMLDDVKEKCLQLLTEQEILAETEKICLNLLDVYSQKI